MLLLHHSIRDFLSFLSDSLDDGVYRPRSGSDEVGSGSYCTPISTRGNNRPCEVGARY